MIYRYQLEIVLTIDHYRDGGRWPKLVYCDSATRIMKLLSADGIDADKILILTAIRFTIDSTLTDIAIIYF